MKRKVLVVLQSKIIALIEIAQEFKSYIQLN